MRLTKPFDERSRSLALATTGVVQFFPEGKSLKVHRDHPDWDLPLSPHFVNMRVDPEGPLKAWQAEMFGQDMALAWHAWRVMQGTEDLPLQIVGIPNAAKSLAKGFADAWPGKITLLEMFKEGEGKGVIVPRIEGNIDPGLPITLIDDVITKGGSKVDALAIIRSMGYNVDSIIVEVDREQGGREEMEKEGITLYSVTSFSCVLEYCRSLGMIDEDQYIRCTEYPALLDAAIGKHTT